MPINTEGAVPIKIVELLITNINALTKEIQNLPEHISTVLDDDLKRITQETEHILNNLKTPPRNEELDVKLDKVQKNVKILSESVELNVTEKIKKMTFSVWLVFGLFTIAIFLSSLFINFNNEMLLKKLNLATKKTEERVDRETYLSAKDLKLLKELSKKLKKIEQSIDSE